MKSNKAMSNLPSYQFSIILPVRNGGSYIKECINSILSQTITGFNLIVLESGSTDGTQEWLKSLIDPRIIIHYSETPLSITENWDRIKHVERNKWMTIIGHDDVLHPNYLETMSKLIGENSLASLYQSHFNFIDDQGLFMRTCKPMKEKIMANGLLDSILSNNINIFGTGFMMRSVDYDAVGGIPLFPNLLSADYVLWIELTSRAFLAVSKEYCFSYRINESTTFTTKMERYIEALQLFVDYLLRKKIRLQPDITEKEYANKILSFYCTRISRRLLTMPLKERNNLTVTKFLRESKTFAIQYTGCHDEFDPSAITGIWIAKLIDQIALTRSLFRLFKRIHPNPILK